MEELRALLDMVRGPAFIRRSLRERFRGAHSAHRASPNPKPPSCDEPRAGYPFLRLSTVVGEVNPTPVPSDTLGSSQ